MAALQTGHLLFVAVWGPTHMMQLMGVLTIRLFFNCGVKLMCCVLSSAQATGQLHFSAVIKMSCLKKIETLQELVHELGCGEQMTTKGYLAHNTVVCD